MARSAEGITLTRQHRELQLRVRAGALRDFTRIWPLWRGDEESFGQLVTATLPLVRAHRQVSAAVASTYYRAFRRAERAPGVYTPTPAPPLDDSKVTASLYVTGAVMTRKALAAGATPEAAMSAALVRTSGAMTRHVLEGGRGTLLSTMKNDPHVHRWARVTGGGKTCSFCEMLAERGAVFSAETADFQAHDHCSCSAEPSFS